MRAVANAVLAVTTFVFGAALLVSMTEEPGRAIAIGVVVWAFIRACRP